MDWADIDLSWEWQGSASWPKSSRKKLSLGFAMLCTRASRFFMPNRNIVG
jgi:hypothetical protein